MSEVEDAIRAWLRLDQAMAAVNQELARSYGITGAQLGMLRLINEFGGVVTLAELRQRLSLHPASLGQLVARLAEKDWVALTPDAADRRRRRVRITDKGRSLLRRAPLVGPVRLRATAVDPAVLRHIVTGFDLAVEAFGLLEYSKKGSPQ